VTPVVVRSALPAVVRIREVGPRDGLQAEAPVPARKRAAVVEALADAGLQEIEAVSFVSPRAVPAMAGAAEVMATVRRKPAVRYLALVPNRKGAELALQAGMDGLTVTVSASPAYNERNVHMTIDQSVRGVAEIAEVVAPPALPVDAVVSCAFGSPYEGDIDPVDVHRLGERLAQGRCVVVDVRGHDRDGHPPAGGRAARAGRAPTSVCTCTTRAGRLWSTPTQRSSGV